MKTGILILAAGNSSRMGRPKQLLKWGESNLLSHVISEANKVVGSHVYVVLGHNAAEIHKEMDGKSAHFIVNSRYHLGIGSSISFGVESIQTLYENVLVLLGDQPGIHSRYIEAIIRTAKKNKEKIITSRYQDGYGAPCLFPLRFYPSLMKLKNDFGARRILTLFENDMIILDEEVELIDIDFEEDYDTALKKFNNFDLT